MPKDNIERAIKRAAGGEDDSDNYEEMRYEGYGPGGVAVIVEALTDNRNRTAGEVRAAFSKYGGTLGETNSVSFMFDRVGVIVYPADAASAEAIFEAAVEAGASNVDSTSEQHEVTCDPDDFSTVRDALTERFGDPQAAELTWRPQTTVAIDEEKAQTMFKMLDVLDESDDVQRVSANFDISDEMLARLTA
jgi:YebC/PmpR family DNA-binding regulatory protein